jgi:hypothetical protein
VKIKNPEQHGVVACISGAYDSLQQMPVAYIQKGNWTFNVITIKMSYALCNTYRYIGPKMSYLSI